MISASDFRKGTKFIYEKEPFSVVEFQHVKPGKGGAFVRTKMKSLLTGLMREATFRVEEKFDQPDIQHKDMQYLYKDGDSYCFMDQKTFDQVYLTKNQVEEVLSFLKQFKYLMYLQYYQFHQQINLLGGIVWQMHLRILV